MTHQSSAPAELVGPGSRTPSPAASALWCAAVLALASAVTAPVWVTAFVGVVVALVAFFTLREQLGQRGQGLLVAATSAGLLALPASVVFSLLVGAGVTDGLLNLGADEVSDGGGSTGDDGGSSGGSSGGEGTAGTGDDQASQAPATRWVVLPPSTVVSSAHAPASQDSLGQVVTFLARNTVDGELDTAWRVPGDGVGHWVRLTWTAPVTIARVGLVPGYAKVDADGTDRFTQNRRVTAFELLSDTNASIGTWTPADAPSMQYANVTPPLQTSSLTVRVVSTTAAGERDYTAISEIQVVGRR